MKINNFNSNQHLSNNAHKNIQSALNNIAVSRAIDSKDGANLTIADSLKSTASELTQGVSNANDAIGFLNIADSTLANASKTADRIQELSVTLNRPGINDDQRRIINNEASALTSSIEQGFRDAVFNGKNVFGDTKDFLTGNGLETINLNYPNTNSINVNNQSSINDFSQQLNNLRSDIGSLQNGIFSGINVAVSNSINTRSSESQLQDNDIAKNLEKINQNKNQIEAGLISQAHNFNILQNQISRLLS